MSIQTHPIPYPCPVEPRLRQAPVRVVVACQTLLPVNVHLSSLDLCVFSIARDLHGRHLHQIYLSFTILPMQHCITVPYTLPSRHPHSPALNVSSRTGDNYSTVKPRVAVEARSTTTSLCTYMSQGYANGQPDFQGLRLITASGSGTAWSKSLLSPNYQTNLR